MSLLFNMLSRLIITFLLRSKRLLISWLQSPSAVILEPSDPANVDNLILDSSALSKPSLNIWKFLVQVLLKPSLENFEPFFAIM